MLYLAVPGGSGSYMAAWAAEELQCNTNMKRNFVGCCHVGQLFFICDTLTGLCRHSFTPPSWL